MRRLLFAWLLCATAAAQAAPMGFKDSFMAMGDLSPNWRESWVNYALTPRDAVGLGGIVMRSDDQTLERDVVEANYTHLLKRWNMPHAQANIWFIGGAGVIRGNDFAGTRTVLSPGVQVDYETTRIYLAATARLFRAEGINHDYASLRAGFSFYEVNYEETQPWLVLEVRRMRGLSDKTEITPMLRFIHSRYFVEFGVSNNREARFNFMYIF